MTWRDAVAVAPPLPAARRGPRGELWICYLDGSVDILAADGRRLRNRRLPAGQGEQYTDWDVLKEDSPHA